MTWGRGYGLPWGGGPLIATSQPLAEVAGEPTTLDLTDEPDGPFPGQWEYYALDTDAAGDVTVETEPNPTTFYKVKDGKGLWEYTRAPVLPGVGAPFSERGVAASPSAVVEGANTRVSVIVMSPPALLDEFQDELFYEVAVGLRFNATDHSWVGGRMRARWAGSWVEPLAVEAVQADGQVPSVLSAAVIEPLPDPVDFWRVQPQTEMVVTVRDGSLDVEVGGVWRTSAAVPNVGVAKLVVFVRVYRRQGVLITALPTIVALQFQSLRDLTRLGPGPQLPGDVDLEVIGVLPTLRAPIQELLDGGYLKQVGARRFEALLDFTAEVDEQRWAIKQGERLHAREPWVGQQFVPVSRDLEHERQRGEP